MLVRHVLYPRYHHGVSAKWLKSLALNTVLGGLKVFTGEINIIIVAFVFIMDELHTQEEAKRLSKELFETLQGSWRKGSGDAETIAVRCSHGEYTGRA